MSSSICQTTDLRSFLENILHFANLALMSWWRGTGRFMGRITLLTLWASGVILIDPSGLEAITALDTHGAVSLIECFCMMSCLMISFITLGALSFRWYGTNLGVVATGLTSVLTWSLHFPWKLSLYSLDFIIQIFFNHIYSHYNILFNVKCDDSKDNSFITC